MRKLKYDNMTFQNYQLDKILDWNMGMDENFVQLILPEKVFVDTKNNNNKK